MSDSINKKTNRAKNTQGNIVPEILPSINPNFECYTFDTATSQWVTSSIVFSQYDPVARVQLCGISMAFLQNNARQSVVTMPTPTVNISVFKPKPSLPPLPPITTPLPTPSPGFSLFGLSPTITMIAIIAAGSIVGLILICLIYRAVRPKKKQFSMFEKAGIAAASVIAGGAFLWSIYKLCFGGGKKNRRRDDDDRMDAKMDSIWSQAILPHPAAAPIQQQQQQQLRTSTKKNKFKQLSVGNTLSLASIMPTQSNRRTGQMNSRGSADGGVVYSQRTTAEEATARRILDTSAAGWRTVSN